MLCALMSIRPAGLIYLFRIPKYQRNLPETAMTQAKNRHYSATITREGKWKWTGDKPAGDNEDIPLFKAGDTLEVSQEGTFGVLGICLQEKDKVQRSPFAAPYNERGIFLYDSETTIFTFTKPKSGITHWRFDIEGPLLDLIDPEFQVGPGDGPGDGTP
jgi:hypothetical protein